jgi:hypothetical protein
VEHEPEGAPSDQNGEQDHVARSGSDRYLGSGSGE